MFKFLAQLSPRVLKRYAKFKEDCKDPDDLHYEWAGRFTGLNIEHLPSGKDITVGWF